MTKLFLAEQTDYVSTDQVLMHQSLKYQQIYQAKQLTQSLFTEKMLNIPTYSWRNKFKFQSFFPDRAANNSLNSTFEEQDNLNRTRNLIQQDIQTPSNFVTEEINETKTTTAQQSI